MGLDGNPVLDEAEVTLVLKLGDLKAQYRQDYQDLSGTRAEVSYCQHLVDQCRIRLLTGQFSRVIEHLLAFASSKLVCLHDEEQKPYFALCLGFVVCKAKGEMWKTEGLLLTLAAIRGKTCDIISLLVTQMCMYTDNGLSSVKYLL